MRNLQIKQGIILTCIMLVIIIASDTHAQNNNKIRVSPKAWIGQTIGFTDVNIVYSRPGVKGRKIWGDLVPYGKAWRAGANEATKITFSTDVTIENKKLPKGSYSFFVIPNEKEWTIIFNKMADQWGAFEYNEAEDALRLQVKPAKNENQEWLLYSIRKVNDTTANVVLEWEKVSVSFKVEGASKQ